MEFQEGKGLAKFRSPKLDEEQFFFKVTFENGKHFISIDDGPKKLIDDDVRDWLLNEVHLIRSLRDNYKPQFKKVVFKVEAVGEFGSKHTWTRTSWEGLELLLKKLPGLLDAYVADPKRRMWLHEFVRRAKELRNISILKKS